jgi:hypothetical protein
MHAVAAANYKWKIFDWQTRGCLSAQVIAVYRKNLTG